MGHIEVVKLLLMNGATVHRRDRDLNYIFYAAVCGNHVEVVRQLLDKGVDVNVEGGHYGNVLRAACIKGHMGVVQLLLHKSVDVNADGGLTENALQAASANGNTGIVQLLLQKGVDVNAEDERHGNALQAASASGNISIVQLLLQKGADVNAEGGAYGNALLAASRRGHEQIFRLLLSMGADIHHLGGYDGSVLNTLAFMGHTHLLRLAYDQYHAMQDLEDFHKRNAILLAARRGHFGTFKFLISRGLNSGTKDAKAENLLHYAASGSSLRIFNSVLDNIPTTSFQSEHWSPFHWACRAENPDVVERLVQAGFRNESVTLAQPEGQWTPISIAIFHNNTKMLMRLSASWKALLRIEADLGKQPVDRYKMMRFSCKSCLFVNIYLEKLNKY
jgi:ankyrin repeat protein